MTVDLRRYAPHVCARPNRPDPPERIVRRPRAYVEGDMLMLPIPLSQLARIHAVASRSRDMYELVWEIEEYRGFHPDLMEPACTLDHDAWDQYEAEERVSA